MSQPEPAPLNKGKSVPDELIKWLHSQTNSAEAIQLIRERDEFGRKKYGQPLMTEDGRNSVEDARQELGDLLQYVYKAKMNGEDLTPIREILPHLANLLNISSLLTEPTDNFWYARGGHTPMRMLESALSFCLDIHKDENSILVEDDKDIDELWCLVRGDKFESLQEVAVSPYGEMTSVLLQWVLDSGTLKELEEIDNDEFLELCMIINSLIYDIKSYRQQDPKSN